MINCLPPYIRVSTTERFILKTIRGSWFIYPFRW